MCSPLRLLVGILLVCVGVLYVYLVYCTRIVFFVRRFLFLQPDYLSFPFRLYNTSFSLTGPRSSLAPSFPPLRSEYPNDATCLLGHHVSRLMLYVARRGQPLSHIHPASSRRGGFPSSLPSSPFSVCACVVCVFFVW